MTLSNDVFGDNVETLIFGANPPSEFALDRFKNLRISSIVPAGVPVCTSTIKKDCKCLDVYCRGDCQDDVCVLNGLKKCPERDSVQNCWCSWSVCKADETCANNEHCVKTNDILDILGASVAKARYCNGTSSNTGGRQITSSTGFSVTVNFDSIPFSNKTLLEYYHFKTQSSNTIECS